jgi:hypothetical protein
VTECDIPTKLTVDREHYQIKITTPEDNTVAKRIYNPDKQCTVNNAMLIRRDIPYLIISKDMRLGAT